jgi:mRNA interferase MazF
MVERKEVLTQGGIYLARLDPAKAAEVGKIRPVIVLNAQPILEVMPPIIFVCPLSSQSHPAFASLHITLLPRDNLQVDSFAFVAHCRSISARRIINPRLAHIHSAELERIFHALQRLLGM